MIRIGVRAASGVIKVVGGGILGFAHFSDAASVIGGIIVILGIVDIAIARAMFKERSSK